MSYKDMARKLAALEAGTQGRDGKAPDVWPDLAQWALAVHAAGGWEAAQVIVRRGDCLPLPCPYAGNDAHPHVFPSAWHLQLFGRGGTLHWPTFQQQGETCWLIAEIVGQLIEQGMLPSEIKDWETGRAVWDAIQAEVKQEQA